MSKKIVLLSAIVICAFIYGCGIQKNNDVQQVNTNENNVDVVEIPVAERDDWEPIMAQWWGRGGENVEVNETIEEDTID